MWWPKLFADGPEIAWDDYEKDYSDLPKPILQAHAALEAEKDSVRHLEHHAKTYFDRLQASQLAKLCQLLTSFALTGS